MAALATAAACADDRSGVEELTSALSVCDEVVPANRFVDGIPAYAQCPGFETASIYSNNGVDTSATSLGADWIRTQGSGGYQCTELAHRYLHFRWNVTSWLPRGNAGTWCDTQPTAASGVVQTTVPVHGDLIVFAPGACGADAVTGHVAVIDVVDDARAQVTVVEENRAGRRNAAQSCASCYLHVVANDGSSGAAGASGAAGTGGAVGSGGATGTGGATGAGSAGATGSTGTGGDATGSAGADAGSNTAGTGGSRSGGDVAGAPGAASREAIGGCSVSGAGARTPSGGGLVVAAALLAVVLRRARRRNPLIRA
jgi:MYXO-CTERM domain-containing protein